VRDVRPRALPNLLRPFLDTGAFSGVAIVAQEELATARRP
jgi:hypothetical protein